MDFLGTSGRDNYAGTVDPDEFDMTQGGRDTVSGLDGNDVFLFGGELNDNDQIDGGLGIDKLVLEGNYLGGVVFTATTAVNLEEIELRAGFNYTLTLDDATATGAIFTVDGFLLQDTDSLVFDGSAETATTLSVIGGHGNDVITGGQDGNQFFLDYGGSDTVTGCPTADTFYVAGHLDATDSLVAGAGLDTLNFRGTYAGLTVTAAMASGFDKMSVSALFDTNLTLSDDFIAAGLDFTVDIATINVFGANDVTVDASAETDASLDFTGGISNDTFRGGALGDSFDFQSSGPHTQGGVDIVAGNGGDDVILFDEKFTRDDQVDGGDGFDSLELEGDYSAGINFGAGTMSDVEQLVVAAGYDYVLSLGDNNVRADGFILDGELLGGGDDLDFDAEAESASDLILRGGAGQDGLFAGGGDDSLVGNGGGDLLEGGDGDDTIQGGGGADGFYGGAGADRITAGAGVDIFTYVAVSDSTGPGYDYVGRLRPLVDKFDMDVAVTGVDPRVNGGALSTATFDADLAAEIDAAALAAGHAVVFKPSSGDLADRFFLIVDANAAAGYQAGEDYVMEFAAGSHPNLLATGFFI